MDEKRTDTGTRPQDETSKQGGASGSPEKGDSSYQPGQGGQGGQGGSGWQPGQTEKPGGTTSQPGRGGQGGSQPSDPKKETGRGTDGSES